MLSGVIFSRIRGREFAIAWFLPEIEDWELNAESQRLNLWDAFRVNCCGVYSYAQRWA